ncbi:MAG: radical SAM protein [Ruminococcaceae bacterium]|nr:radical SAM protein [Oscillospiraceae bacterium]
MNDNKFIMKRAGLICSLKCNLNCKLCAELSPYHSKDKFPPFSVLMEYVRKYFNIVDYVKIFVISGGEPLLYKELPNLLNELLQYKERFGRVEIITNGTILPSEDLLNAIKKYDCNSLKFIIDDYGDNLSRMFSEITALCDKNNISYNVNRYHTSNIHCAGWVDYGIPDKVIHTQKDAAELLSKCANKTKLDFCFTIFEGKLVPCFQIINRMNLGRSVDEREYIDLTDNTVSIDEQRKKIMGIYNTDYLEICSYCNGLCDDSERFTPAEQFTKEEIQQISKKTI